MLTLARGGGYAGRAQAGLSLVEMMVGLAVGLMVVAGATMVVTSQLGDNRRLLLETQLQQDLRAAADIITRDLRRAGSWGDDARQGLWTAGAPPVANPFSEVSLPVPPSPAASAAEYRYFRPGSSQPLYGFQRTQNGVLQSLLSNGWQDLTDARVMQVTDFNITRRDSPALQTPCPQLCPGQPSPATACWPTVTVREFDVEIVARSVTDPTIQRSLSTTVRVRNDLVRGACPP